ncbi:TPA: hypothetical protein OT180_002217 [Morganella morganii]|nr:hypothetical protein [Morganella morganii]
MSVMNKPDYKIFAQDAKSGEYVAFPDILRGWGITLEQYGGFPPMELFNSAAKRIDEWLMYLTQRGLPEWDAAVDYPKDAMIQHAGIYYVSLKATKGEQPNNSQASWKKLTETLGIDDKLDKSKVTNSLINSRELVPTTALLIDNLAMKQPLGNYQEAGYSYSKEESNSRYQRIGDSIGYGQKWKDVKNERAVRTNYINDLSKPISIFVRLGESESQGVGILVDGVTAALFTAAGPNVSQGATVIVPPGSRYYVYAPSGKENIFEWTELR